MSMDKPEILVSKKYHKKNLFVESWLRLRTNPGAVFGLGVIVLMLLLLIYSLIFISFDQIMAINPANRLQPPSASHPFGTDQMGRDVLTRVVFGTRYSLTVGFGAVAIGFIFGVFLGAIGGFYGGWRDETILRVSDIITAVPALLLGMVIVQVLGASLFTLLLAVGISNIPGFARMTRAAVLAVKDAEYVEASRAIGMSEFRIIFTQVLPNSLSPLIVIATSRLATSILMAASLSFLGFGIPPPLPEWGALVSAGRNYMRIAPHITLYPGLVIMLVTFALAILGDGLRDALDPRLKK